MELDSNAYSMFLLYSHLILVVKYRRKIFDGDISGHAEEIFRYTVPKYNITLQEWNHDKDHVPILFKAHPESETSRFINAYKSAGSRQTSEKGISADTPEVLEGIFLESEFLFAYNRKRTCRSN